MLCEAPSLDDGDTAGSHRTPRHNKTKQSLYSSLNKCCGGEHGARPVMGCDVQVDGGGALAGVTQGQTRRQGGNHPLKEGLSGRGDKCPEATALQGPAQAARLAPRRLRESRRGM